MGVHHAWGRTYKDAYQRYFAMTGHELRYQNGFDCQGLWVEVEVEKELKLQSKRDIENLVPGDPFASIDQFVQLCKDRVDKFARMPDRAVDPPRLLDGLGPHRRRLGQAAGRTASLLHDVGGEQLHDLELSEEMPRARPDLSRLRRHAVVPALRRRPQPDGDERGLPARRAPVGVRASFPLRRAEPGEKPARLDHDALDADQQRRRRRQSGTDLSQGQAQGRDLLPRQGRLHRPAAGRAVQDARNGSRACRSSRRSSRSSRKRAASRSSAKCKGADMVGWPYDGPFDELPAQQPSGRLSRRDRRRRASSRTGRRRSRRRTPIASSPGRTSARRKAPASSTSPPAAARRTSSSARSKACRPIAPLDESGVFLPASAPSTGKSAVDPATTDWILANLQEKGRAVRRREVSAQLSALLALQDGTALPPGRRVVHRHVVARRDHEGRRADVTLPARVDQRQGPRAGLAQEHGRLDDLQEALLGPGAADLGGRGDRRFRGDRLARRN